MTSLSFPVFVAIVSICILHARQTASQGQQYKRVCYHTNWAQYRPTEGKYLPEDIDPTLCTHIIYAFAKLNGNKLIAFEWNDESTEWMRGMYARFNDHKKRNPELKTLLAVGGWNMASKPFTAMVATAASRREFATSSVSFLRQRGFDGVDIDWEYPANRGSPPEDRTKFTQLIAEVRRAFDEEARRTGRAALLLTSAVAAGKDKIDTAYDVQQICRDMDFISVMAYDLHGSWENITGHNSPLFPYSEEKGDQRFLNMDWASNYWVQMGCPKEKLIIGMGLYGRSFTLTDPYQNGLMAPVRGKGEAGKYTREGGFLAYYEICDMINTKGGQSYYIKEQESPYVVLGDQWAGYDDTDSLRIKVQWMKQNGFAGVMVWALDLDDFMNMCGQGKYPLMRAINQELEGSSLLGPIKSRPNRVTPDPAEVRRQIAMNVHTTASPNLPHLTNEFDCPKNANKYFASPTSCEEYFICAGELTFKFKCAPPLRWNSQSNFCDWPVNVRCNPKMKVKTQASLAPQGVPSIKTPLAIIPTTVKPRPTPTTRTPTTTLPPTVPPTLSRKQPSLPILPRKQPSLPTLPRKQQSLPTLPRKQPTPTATTQSTPPWMDWSVWITEFWKALSNMPTPPGGLPWMQQQSEQQNNNLNENLNTLDIMSNRRQPEFRPHNFCQGKLDGIHPDPTDCTTYIDCVQGRDYKGSCPAGTAFDSNYGICDYIHKITRCNV